MSKLNETYRSKKIKLRIFILFLLTTCCLLQSCKYEDGPIISFRTADRRLQGEFQADAFNIDGQDAFQIWTDSICNDFFRIDWKDVGNKFSVYIRSSFGGCSGSYYISSDKKKLGFVFFDVVDGQYMGYGPFKHEKQSEWKILKLSNKKLWVETTFEGHYYCLKLKKNKDLPYNY
jgi:hypothetical protein